MAKKRVEPKDLSGMPREEFLAIKPTPIVTSSRRIDITIHKPKITKSVIVATVLLCLLSGSIVYAAWTISRIVSNTFVVGSLNFNVYQDVACTIPITSIDWATLNTNQVVNKTVYLKNTGTGAISVYWSYSGTPSFPTGTTLKIYWIATDGEWLWAMDNVGHNLPIGATGQAVKLCLTIGSTTGSGNFNIEFHSNF